MEEALRRSEKRFRQVAENAKEWIWEVDAEGYYTYTSPVVEQLLGYTPEEILGRKRFHDFVHPDDAERMQAQSARIFRCKDVFRDVQTRAVHKNGTVVWLQRSGVPILGENQELLGYRGADVDITARVGAREALSCHVREIERFNRLATARELRVIELKRRVNELARAAGQTPPYELPAKGACMEEAEIEESATPARVQPQPARDSTEYRLEDLLDRDQIQRLLDSCAYVPSLHRERYGFGEPVGGRRVVFALSMPQRSHGCGFSDSHRGKARGEHLRRSVPARAGQRGFLPVSGGRVRFR